MNRPPLKFEFSRTRSGSDAAAEARQAAAAVNLSLQSDDNAEREFEFNEKDFARVRALILKIAGISLAPSKQSMVYSRLARRLRACKHNRFSSYLDAHELNSSNTEREHFTNSLTTKLTSI